MKINRCKRCFSNELDYSNEKIPYSDKYRTYIKCRKCGFTIGIETPLHRTSMEEMVNIWNEKNSSSIIPIEEVSCENCKHCIKLNKNKIYSICDEMGKIFKLWEDDTRTYKCDSWIKKDI